MRFALLFVFVSWISVNLCPTRAQGEFEIFPGYLLCILSILITTFISKSVFFSLGKDGF